MVIPLSMRRGHQASHLWAAGTLMLPMFVLSSSSKYAASWRAGIQPEYSVDTAAVLAFTSLAMLPALICFTIFQKKIVGGLTARSRAERTAVAERARPAHPTGVQRGRDNRSVPQARFLSSLPSWSFRRHPFHRGEDHEDFNPVLPAQRGPRDSRRRHLLHRQPTLIRLVRLTSREFTDLLPRNSKPRFPVDMVTDLPGGGIWRLTCPTRTAIRLSTPT